MTLAKKAPHTTCGTGDETKYFCNFATMRKLILTFMALLAIGLMGCDNSSQLADYTVTCTLHGHQQHDSATLLVLEDTYNQLRQCGTVRIKDGSCTFKGQTDGAKVGIIRWDNDSTRPFYFVLEGGHTSITIETDSWTITGSKGNSNYLHYINQRKAIMDARVGTWQEYLKMAADKSLKREDERRLVVQDSLLNDSLQRITVDCINRGDAVGRIVSERYGNQLDNEHLKLLK